MFSREEKDVALSVSGVLVAERTWKAVSAGCLGLTPSQWATQTGIHQLGANTAKLRLV